MTKKYYKRCLLSVLFLFTSSWLFGQSSLKNLQEVQFLSQNQCVVIQVNADWNAGSSIDLGNMKNCVWFNASIDNKEYGAGLSFKLNADDIKKAIEKEIDNILLRRFQ